MRVWSDGMQREAGTHEMDVDMAQKCAQDVWCAMWLIMVCTWFFVACAMLVAHAQHSVVCTHSDGDVCMCCFFFDFLIF